MRWIYSIGPQAITSDPSRTASPERPRRQGSTPPRLEILMPAIFEERATVFAAVIP